ncbi:GTPase subunit of restriction endonuclease [Marinitoga piezophila KA3]|uniref:GTPase subunit of restriction endonuclease n=1 Tax=Marinitoga piezophila (strain DSM 14283 / JCM 11233 / KA3) TaxID=443254 RepID=H2J896_MARPK|nr:AAA family ATPase [Marinitoga piezophila]AEX85580.1 GTPase subunit of restriction endonuclease [Marinitoga piezophila KA3]
MENEVMFEEIVEYEDYKNWAKKDKINFLNEKFGTNNSILKGTIQLASSEKYFLITNLRNIENDIIINPFNNEILRNTICLCENVDSFLLKRNLKVGDEVIFKFTIPFSQHEDKNKLIIAKSKTVYKVTNIMEILDNIDNNVKEKEIFSAVNLIEFLEQIREKDFGNKINSIINERILLVNKNIDNYLKEIKNKIQTQEERLKELENIVSEKEFEIKELEILRNKYIELGILNEDNVNEKKEEIIKEEYIDIKDKKEQIDYIQKYLALNKGLYYDDHILKRFFLALHTNQIIILSGEPGTGKTSLVRGFSEAISAKHKIISVQPNWTDNQDLLGFYNPIENVYVPTPFLDAIIEAKENQDRLYILCLDEMNLSHVEYYFSEFLSKIQSDKILDLYSKKIYDENLKELNMKWEKYLKYENKESLKEELSNEEFNEFLALKRRYNLLKKYKAQVEIPDNIRFVGTVNKDETTKSLSPKVIDRSFVIEVKEYDENLVSKFSELEKENYQKRLYLKESDFKMESKDILDEIKEELEEIKLIFKKMRVYLNNRFDNQVKQILGNDYIDRDDLLDYIISSMILPKINISINERNEQIIDEISKLLEKTKVSKVIFDEMKEFAETEYILTFWR